MEKDPTGKVKNKKSITLSYFWNDSLHGNQIRSNLRYNDIHHYCHRMNFDHTSRNDRLKNIPKYQIWPLVIILTALSEEKVANTNYPFNDILRHFDSLLFLLKSRIDFRVATFSSIKIRKHRKVEVSKK